MQDSTGDGKGGEYRPVNRAKYESEFDRIFRKANSRAVKKLRKMGRVRLDKQTREDILKNGFFDA